MLPNTVLGIGVSRGSGALRGLIRDNSVSIKSYKGIKVKDSFTAWHGECHKQCNGYLIYNCDLYGAFAWHKIQ